MAVAVYPQCVTFRQDFAACRPALPAAGEMHRAVPAVRPPRGKQALPRAGEMCRAVLAVRLPVGNRALPVLAAPLPETVRCQRGQ